MINCTFRSKNGGYFILCHTTYVDIFQVETFKPIGSSYNYTLKFLINIDY